MANDFDDLFDLVEALKGRCHSFILGAVTNEGAVVLSSDGSPHVGLGMCHDLAACELRRCQDFREKALFEQSMKKTSE